MGCGCLWLDWCVKDGVLHGHWSGDNVKDGCPTRTLVRGHVKDECPAQIMTFLLKTIGKFTGVLRDDLSSDRCGHSSCNAAMFVSIITLHVYPRYPEDINRGILGTSVSTIHRVNVGRLV